MATRTAPASQAARLRVRRDLSFAFLFMASIPCEPGDGVIPTSAPSLGELSVDAQALRERGHAATLLTPRCQEPLCRLPSDRPAHRRPPTEEREAMSNALNWFEIPVTDLARAKEFYGRILQADLREESLSGRSMAILPYQNGGVGGAIIQGEHFVPSADGTVVYLDAGDDLAGAL